MKKNVILLTGISALIFLSFRLLPSAWNSRWVKLNKDGSLTYTPDKMGNIIPDFSRVGYGYGEQEIPVTEVTKTIEPVTDGSSEERIQAAINELSKRSPDKNGIRGTLLLKKGKYIIPNSIKITVSGIVLRGEGVSETGTNLISTSDKQVSLIDVSGTGNIKEVPGSRNAIKDEYVPVGATSFSVFSTRDYKAGDRIIVYRPSTSAWISDLKMDQIEARQGTKQWKEGEYDLRFERIVTKVEGNKIHIDNPIVMAMEKKYGGGEVYRYTFDGRISNVGIEFIRFTSSFQKDTSENHAWNAVSFNKIENGWVRGISSYHFGYACVSLESMARNISVLGCYSYDPKSVITGGRRYSFNNGGQLNLFLDCHAVDGRHDFVTGAKVCGPNVFAHCTAKKTHADIGPHHRWAAGTLYDNITTDGEINVQDRGNWGSGHGWAGVTQVLWNCTVKRAAIQNPWVSGANYSIGTKGEKFDGRLKGRPDGEWEAQNQNSLQPVSLYDAQHNLLIQEVRKKRTR